jgi:CRP-like cAMP-binding protein
MKRALRTSSGRRTLAIGADRGPITNDSVKNRFWQVLPASAREHLISHAKRVWLNAGDPVFQAHEPLRALYFPETAVISRIARLKDGQTLEIGLIGSDGVAGISILPGTVMPYDGIVQIAGTAIRITAAAMAELLRQPGPTHDLLGKYAWAIMGDSIQGAACNNFHGIGQRCARWLLMMHDTIGQPDFPITQDLLAQMIGVRRATITQAARAFQRQGIVDYKHGRLTIRDRPALEAASCECYRIMRDTHRHLLGL